MEKIPMLPRHPQAAILVATFVLVSVVSIIVSTYFPGISSHKLFISVDILFSILLLVMIARFVAFVKLAETNLTETSEDLPDSFLEIKDYVVVMSNKMCGILGILAICPYFPKKVDNFILPSVIPIEIPLHLSLGVTILLLKCLFFWWVYYVGNVIKKNLEEFEAN